MVQELIKKGELSAQADLELGTKEVIEEKESESTDLKATLPNVVTYPDGGLKAWSVVAGAFCVSFTSWGYVNCFGLFQDQYSLHQLKDYSASQISWIGSFQLFLVLACAILSGKLFDAGYLKVCKFHWNRLLTDISKFLSFRRSCCMEGHLFMHVVFLVYRLLQRIQKYSYHKD